LVKPVDKKKKASPTLDKRMAVRKSFRSECRGVIRLPGGSRVVIDGAPLREFCRAAFAKPGAGGLMFLDKVEDLFPFLRAVPADHPTGEGGGQCWLVSEVLDGHASWTPADVEALRAGLSSGPLAEVLQHELDRIIFVRGLLTDCAIMNPLPRHGLPYS
jgi:hypothetical protein